MASKLALAFDILARDRASSEIDKVGDAADDAGGKLGKLGDAGKVAMGAVAGGAVALGAVAAKGFFDGLEQDAMSDRLAAQLGLNADQQAAFGRAAGELYANAYGDSIGQVNEALASVQSTIGDSLGPAEDALQTTTAKALDLASAFDLDVNDAVNRVGVLINDGLVADAEEGFDLVTAAMQRVAPAIRDELGEATTEYGKFFSQLGIDGSEMFALLTQADDKFELDKMGDALKELTIRATDMSAASTEAYGWAGLNAEEMAAKFVAGGDEARDALGELVSGLQGIEDPVHQANAAIALFGTPLEDLGVSQIPGFLDSLAGMEGGMGDIEGAADAMGDTLNDNLKTKMETWKRQGLQRITDFMMGTVIPGVEAFAPVVQDVFGRAQQVIGDAAGRITGFLDDNQATIDAVGDTVSRVIGGVIDWFGRARAEVGDSSSELGAIVGQLRDLFATYLEGIQVAVETVVKVVTDLWARFGDDIVTYFRESWDNAKEILAGAIDFITGIINIFIAVFTGDWAGLWEAIKQTLSGAWNAMRGIVEQALNVLQTVLKIAMGALSAIWSGAWHGLKTLLSDVWGGIKSTVSGAIDTVVGYVSGMADRIRRAAGGMWDGITSAFRSAINVIIRGWNRIEFRIPGFKIGPVGYDGFTLGVPDIPTLHTGGIFQAPFGQREGLAMLLDGERVLDPMETADYDRARFTPDRSAPLVGGDYIVQVLPEQDPLRRGMYELERIALKHI